MCLTPDVGWRDSCQHRQERGLRRPHASGDDSHREEEIVYRESIDIEKLGVRLLMVIVWYLSLLWSVFD